MTKFECWEIDGILRNEIRNHNAIKLLLCRMNESNIRLYRLIYSFPDILIDEFSKNLEKHFSTLRNWLVSAGFGGGHYSCKIFSAGRCSNRAFFFDRNSRLWNYAHFFLLWFASGSGEFCKRFNKLENALADPVNYVFVLPLDSFMHPTVL